MSFTRDGGTNEKGPKRLSTDRCTHEEGPKSLIEDCGMHEKGSKSLSTDGVTQMRWGAEVLL